MFRSLLRTTPNLTGNITLNCKLTNYTKKDNDTFISEVRSAEMRPLQNSLFRKSINVSLLTNRWDMDVPKFYNEYKDIFYSENFTFDTTDYQILEPYSYDEICDRNKDYEFGCKRTPIGVNNYQAMFFAPMWCDSLEDLPYKFVIEILFDKGLKKKIEIPLNNNSRYNYLYIYLKKHLTEIDNNVLYMNGYSKTALYYGINVKDGGMYYVNDNIITTCFSENLPINEFDKIVCEGFKRNYLIVKQLLPLSFSFNIEDILTNNEIHYVKNNRYTVKGYYKYQNNVKYDFYDFDIDYYDYRFNKLVFDENTFKYVYIKSDNILDLPNKGLKEKRLLNYKYFNKINPIYNKWVIRSIEDEYILNNSTSFGTNYGLFPRLNINTPYCLYDNNNLLLPNEYKELYKNTYKSYYNNFIYFMNSNQLNWFKETNVYVNEKEENIINKSVYTKVNNNVVYYNGILYNLNNLNSINSNINNFGIAINIKYDNFTNKNYLYSNLYENENKKIYYDVYFEEDNEIEDNNIYGIDYSKEYLAENIYVKKDVIVGNGYFKFYDNDDDITNNINKYILDILDSNNSLIDTKKILSNITIDNNLYKLEYKENVEVVKLIKLFEKLNEELKEGAVQINQTIINNIMFEIVTNFYLYINTENNYLKKYVFTCNNDDLYKYINYLDDNKNIKQKFNNTGININICDNNINNIYIYRNVSALNILQKNNINIKDVSFSNYYTMFYSIDEYEKYINYCLINNENIDNLYYYNGEFQKIIESSHSSSEVEINNSNDFNIKYKIEYYDNKIVYKCDDDDKYYIILKQVYAFRLTPDLLENEDFKQDLNKLNILIDRKIELYNIDNSIDILNKQKIKYDLYYNVHNILDALSIYNNTYNEKSYLNNIIDNCILSISYKDKVILTKYNKCEYIKYYNGKENNDIKLFKLLNSENTIRHSYKSQDDNLLFIIDLTLYLNNKNFNILNKTGKVLDYLNVELNIKSINNKDIDNDVILSNFIYIYPYLSKNLFENFYNNYKNIIITNIKNNINNVYSIKEIDNGNSIYSNLYAGIYYDKDNYTDNKKVYQIIKNNFNNKFILNRYFLSVIPKFNNIANNIKNRFNLYYKGKNIYNTISSNNIYNNEININKYKNITYFNNKELEEYNYNYEYKHFNDNKLFNLDKEIIIKHNELVTYDKLLELESKEECLKIFTEYISKYIYINKDEIKDEIDTYKENLILFLYNKYNINLLSQPKLINLNDKKLYELIYKFTLI